MNDFNSEKSQNKAVNAGWQNPILKSVNVIPYNFLRFNLIPSKLSRNVLSDIPFEITIGCLHEKYM
jgi:hypothetical protein